MATDTRDLSKNVFGVFMPQGWKMELSSIDGAAFQFNVGGTLSPLDVLMLAQQALNYKAAGINGPVRRTQAFFI